VVLRRVEAGPDPAQLAAQPLVGLAQLLAERGGPLFVHDLIMGSAALPVT
jgi:hypothetical protein